jgi:uncharacterized protein (DUF58 family)
MFLTRRFYLLMTAIILLFIAGFWCHYCYWGAIVALALIALLLLIDVISLYYKRGIDASRICAERLSNGDDNNIEIRVESSFPFPVKVNVIDEVPFVFQRRDINFATRLKALEGKSIIYQLRPTKRGVYGFGKIRVFTSSPIGLIQRRFTCGTMWDVKVYPSYLMFNQYELMAISNNLTEYGIKKIRRVGNNTEFEQIKDYVSGDDYRTINWKATARRNKLMVNVYTDEKSQQVLNVIDKGRVMQQAFNGMTLLDYAINASLVLSYIAMHKEDKAGVITFERQFDTFVRPERSNSHMQKILDNLYHQETTFGESDFSSLCVNVGRFVTKRSLLIIYTNFFGQNSLMRQLTYLKQLTNNHVVLVVFFEDTELDAYSREPSHDMQDYYCHAVAQNVEYEKHAVVTTLRQNGIYALLTKPENLTISVINRYLEMKAAHTF